jgi:hypothetical protein
VEAVYGNGKSIAAAKQPRFLAVPTVRIIGFSKKSFKRMAFFILLKKKKKL